MKKIYLLLVLMVFIIGFTQISCKQEEVDANLYTYRVPVQREDGWAVGRLNQYGIDVRPIEEMIRGIKNNQYLNIHSVLIIKDNALLLEEYFPGKDYDGTDVVYDWNVAHFQASCSKSITSACIGIAIDRGLFAIPGSGPGNSRETALNRKMIEFFPQYTDIQWSERKQRISLQHMLTMSTGIRWDESTYSYLDSRSDHYKMFNSADASRFMLELEQIHEPGTIFSYSSGVTFLLGAVLKQVSSLPVDDFAKQYLFDPLGISDVSWLHVDDGSVLAGGGCYLRPRDMAKLGQLYLMGGVWNGNRIISAEWINESSRKRFDVYANGTGYGYQWWTNQFRANGQTIHAFSAEGWGGQFIYVFPSLNMVVVFTGGNFAGAHPVNDMVARHILPAAL